MVIVCRGCGARFRMAHALFQDAKGACIRCRKCGGHIEVRHPEASPVPAGPEVPRTPGYDPVPTALPETREVVPKEDPVKAPVLPIENPLSHAPSSDAPVPPENPEPGEAVFSPSAPVADTNPFSSGGNSYDAGPLLADVPVGNPGGETSDILVVSPTFQVDMSSAAWPELDSSPPDEQAILPVFAKFEGESETVPPMDAPDAAPANTRTRDGVNKKIYTVYRIGYWNNKLELIGKVVERRKEERSNNASDMLRWAQKIYAASSIDSNIFIVNEGSSGGPIFGGA